MFLSLLRTKMTKCMKTTLYQQKEKKIKRIMRAFELSYQNGKTHENYSISRNNNII